MKSFDVDNNGVMKENTKRKFSFQARGCYILHWRNEMMEDIADRENIDSMTSGNS